MAGYQCKVRLQEDSRGAELRGNSLLFHDPIHANSKRQAEERMVDKFDKTKYIEVNCSRAHGRR